MQVSEQEMKRLKRKALGNKLLNAALWCVLIGAICGIIPSVIGVANLMIIRIWMFAPMALLLLVAAILFLIGLPVRLSAGHDPKPDKNPDTEETAPRRASRARTTRTETQNVTTGDANIPGITTTTETQPASQPAETRKSKGPRHGRHGRH